MYSIFLVFFSFALYLFSFLSVFFDDGLFVLLCDFVRFGALFEFCSGGYIFVFYLSFWTLVFNFLFVLYFFLNGKKFLYVEFFRSVFSGGFGVIFGVAFFYLTLFFVNLFMWGGWFLDGSFYRFLGAKFFVFACWPLTFLTFFVFGIQRYS